MTAREGKDHRVVSGKLTELADRALVIRQRIVREDAAGPDIGAHRPIRLSIVSLVRLVTM